MRDIGFKRALSAAPWAAIDAVTTALYGVLFLFVVSLFVGPADLGMSSSALAFVLLVEAITSAGVQDVVIRLPSSDTRQTDAAYCLATGLSLIGMPFVWVAAFLYSWASSEPKLFPLAVFASLMLPLNAVAVVPTGMLIRKMRGRQLLFRPVAGKVLGMAAMVILAWMGMRAYAVVAGSVFTSLGGALALFGAATRWPRLRWNHSLILAHIRFAALSGIDNLLYMMGSRLLTLAFASAFGMRALGLLQLAMRLVDELSRLLQSILMRYALALFASYRRTSPLDSTEATRRGLVLATRLTNMLGVPAFVGLTCVGDIVVRVLFGHDWDASAFYVRILAIATLLIFARLLVSPALKAVNRPDLVAFAASVSFLSALVVIAAASSVSAHTLIAIWAAREILATYVWYRLARTQFHVGASDIFQALAPSWSSGLLMAAALTIVRSALPTGGNLINLVALVATGIVIYGASLLMWERRRVAGLLHGCLRPNKT